VLEGNFLTAWMATGARFRRDPRPTQRRLRASRRFTPPANFVPETDLPELPFRGGWGLFLAYELAAQVEPVLRLPPAPGPLPVALALRCPAVIARDATTAAALRWRSRARSTCWNARSRHRRPLCAWPPLAGWRAPQRVVEDDPERFLAGVGKVHDYSPPGDVFQVNLSRRWRAEFRRRS
jgi:anthranilate synthase component 1